MSSPKTSGHQRNYIVLTFPFCHRLSPNYARKEKTLETSIFTQKIVHYKWVVKFSVQAFNFLSFMNLELKTIVAYDDCLGPVPYVCLLWDPEFVDIINLTFQ